MTAGIRVSVTQPSAPTSMEHTNTGLPFGLFRFFNMNNPIIFAGALTVFAGALPPWAPGDGDASSSVSWSSFSPPSNVVSGHVSTMWFMICRWPQSQEGD